MLEIPSIKILLLINEKGEVRFTDLTKLIASRGALSSNLQALENEGLINRRVETGRPIRSFYDLTGKGKKIANSFQEIKRTIG